jgi:uncharacterized protein
MIDRACLSLNNTCNLHCRYCNFRKRDQITGDEAFSLDELSSVIVNILYYSRENNLLQFKIGLVGAGEPILNFEKIMKTIEFSEREDTNRILLFYTITNGTLVNKDILDFLYAFKHRITLNFSLDGYEDLHNYGRTGFKKTAEVIKLYENIFREKPAINCTVTKQTLNNRKRVMDYFHSNGFKNVNFTKLVDSEDTNLTITYEEYDEFLQFVRQNYSNKITFRQNRKEKKYDCKTYGKLCGVGHNNIFITKRGIYPCYRFYKDDAYKLANFNSPLDEAVAGMQKLFQTGISGEECYYDSYERGLL